ncbi:MAG: hypothetical protein COU10_02205 [Candidatus Harrisonbacteria bacterium CG10_big_fil_rev_8_21_14_0_10_45_28]|uniref:Uncharacterized protein n=1 Tax=Candidatus Harrisonbacteria bacterium CG10_big_fil_rev_8_21_14_0_10_45_28 TaxID=1974586 RepID=A0A2H0UN86_9BACT|nr:MAG: hypothetical protein COU10_02205 [Candidatus Harrisonbacteria bacterium CG10_big_fil_rev_8_21_14_0_10_45_28]
MLIDENVLKIISETLRMVGEVMIAYTAIRVHYRFRKEHKIDADVFASMKREQGTGIAGIIFLVAGYLLQIFILL